MTGPTCWNRHQSLHSIHQKWIPFQRTKQCLLRLVGMLNHLARQLQQGPQGWINLVVRRQHLMEVALLMQLLFVVAHTGFHQHLRDLVF